MTGVVRLSCAPRPGLEWSVGPEAPWQLANKSTVTLQLRVPGGDAEMIAYVRVIDDGWSNGVAIGRIDKPLQRVVAHWFNLPNWHGPGRLTATDSAGQHLWSGRWIAGVGSWRITINVRRDHGRIWTDLDMIGELDHGLVGAIIGTGGVGLVCGRGR